MGVVIVTGIVLVICSIVTGIVIGSDNADRHRTEWRELENERCVLALANSDTLSQDFVQEQCGDDD